MGTGHSTHNDQPRCTFAAAALSLGATPNATFWQVTLPLIRPGVLVGALFAFITSFDEFLLAFFLSGTEATLPVYIWGQLRFPGRLPMVLALGVGGAGMIAFACGARR